jgi:hypothetical protein
MVRKRENFVGTINISSKQALFIDSSLAFSQLS